MKVKIKNLTFKCIIGILPFERKKKQNVSINISFKYKFKENEFIDYSKVVQTVEKIMKKEKFLLIEEAILCLNKRLKDEFDICKLKISITKPNIINNCIVGVSN